jgi:hypothetical protein
VRHVIGQGAAQQVGGRAARQRLQRADHFGAEAAVARRVRVDHLAAADRQARRGLPQDVAVAAHRCNWALQAQLEPAFPARLHVILVEHGCAARHLARADEQIERHVVRNRARRVGHHAHMHIQQIGWPQHAGPRQHIAAPQIMVRHAGQVHGHARAGQRLLLSGVVGLQAAHARPQAARQHFDFVADRKRPVGQRAGHHRAEAPDREGAVDRQARRAARPGARRRLVELRIKRLEQFGDALAGARRHGDHGRIREGGALEPLAHVLFDQRQPFVVHQIGLGQHDQPMRDAEQVEDRKVFDGLRHHSLIGSNDQQGSVDSADARQHVFDEALMARHIHDADAAAARQRQPCETEINRHLALLFFFPAVGVNAGERFNQSRLAMVHMACGANDVHSRLVKIMPVKITIAAGIVARREAARQGR